MYIIYYWYHKTYLKAQHNYLPVNSPCIGISVDALGRNINFKSNLKHN